MLAVILKIWFAVAMSAMWITMISMGAMMVWDIASGLFRDIMEIFK